MPYQGLQGSKIVEKEKKKKAKEDRKKKKNNFVLTEIPSMKSLVSVFTAAKDKAISVVPAVKTAFSEAKEGITSLFKPRKPQSAFALAY